MERRCFLQALGAGTASLALNQLSLGTEGAVPLKTNIIFILADDLGYGDLGCYGQTKIQTPHIDRLAAEGMRFTNHYTGSPVCAPARCSLMTGLHTGHCTLRDDQAKAGKRKLVPLSSDDTTIASLLKEGKYMTGVIGKWGLGNPGTTGTPLQHGFRWFFGYLDQVHAHDYYTDYLLRDRVRIPLKGNVGGKKEHYTHDILTEDALAFINLYEKEEGTPFFLYLPFTLPGGECVVPDDAPYTSENWSQRDKNYAAAITRLDRDVGRIMALLKEKDIEDNTIVFFTSDNGPNPPFIEFFNSAGGLRGGKRSLYEGGIRVPMIVRWPGKVPAGKVSDFPWAFWDFLPTAAELAGLEPAKNIDGMSVVPTLLGKEQTPHEYLYWEFYDPFHQAVRMGDWKGVRFGAEEPLELYDLSADPAEKNDAAAQRPEIVKKIEGIMAEAHTDSPYWPVVGRADAERK
ncbi:MAG TPA: arylsulfatase [Sumerlaeia bacterium]|nr:arylsulfatase [Sumerlaeia bacterium]